MRFSAILIPLSVAPFAAAHCKITSATGNAGGKSVSLGQQAGSGNSESDVTVFSRSGAGFGSTPGGGKIDPASALPAAMKLSGGTQMAQVTPGGSVDINMHVVNQDGAGPMTCSMSSDASGTNWQKMQVTQNVPGFNGLSLAANQDYPMKVVMPAGAACTGNVGGYQGVCMVKCQNPIGPFGGTVPVQMAQAGGAAQPAAPAQGDNGATKAAAPAAAAQPAGPAAPAAQSAAQPAAGNAGGLNNALQGGLSGLGLGGLFGKRDGAAQDQEPDQKWEEIHKSLGISAREETAQKERSVAGRPVAVRSILEEQV